MAIKVKTLPNSKKRVFYSDENKYIKRPGKDTLYKQILCIGPTKERYEETNIEIEN